MLSESRRRIVAGRGGALPSSGIGSTMVLFLVLGGCTPQDAQDLLAPLISDCFDEDGCGGGPTLDAWRSFQWFGSAQFTEVGSSEEERSFFLVISSSPAVVCPPVFRGEATLDGAPLRYLGDQNRGIGCPAIAWELPPESWPAEHQVESEVVVTSGQTELVARLPFSLTRSRSWSRLDPDARVVAGGEISFVQEMDEASELAGRRVFFRRGNQEVVVNMGVMELVGTFAVPVPSDLEPGTWEVEFSARRGHTPECDGRAEHCAFSVFTRSIFDVVVDPPNG